MIQYTLIIKFMERWHATWSFHMPSDEMAIPQDDVVNLLQTTFYVAFIQ